MAYVARLHRTFDSSDGIHQIHHWETDDLDTVEVTSDDIGKVARVDDGEGAFRFYLLIGTHPSEDDTHGDWREVAADMAGGLSDDDPEDVVAPGDDGPLAGESDAGARSDHRHVAEVAAPVAIGTANDEGTSASLARSDHVHDGSALITLAIVNDGGTAITLSVTHVGAYLRCTAATDAVVTVPLNFTDLPIGQSISGVQAGAGRIQIVGAVGVTINGVRTYTLEQWSPFSILKVAANAYDLSGDLVQY